MNLEEGSTVGLGLFTRWCHGVRELFYIIGGSLRQVCSEPLQLDPVGMTLVSILGGKTSCLPIKFGSFCMFALFGFLPLLFLASNKVACCRGSDPFGHTAHASSDLGLQ